MRIAVPLSGGTFGMHFGQARAFWLCDVDRESRGISGERQISMPPHRGCGAVAGMLAREGVNLVIAGGIGSGAISHLAGLGIEVVAGAAPADPRTLVQLWLDGKLVSSGAACAHHGDGAGHQHRHQHRHGQQGCCHSGEQRT